MAILHPPVTPASQLHWNSRDRTYAGEISSTNGFGRVYDDACDEGLTLIGETGRSVVFVIDHTSRDAEGEVTGWTLRPAVRLTPGFRGVTLILFND